MKTKLFFILLFFSSTVLLGQQRYLIHGGASIPLGVYGQEGTEDAGYAQTGYAFTFENMAFLNDNFGFGFLLSYQTQGINNGQIAQDILDNSEDLALVEYRTGDYRSFIAMLEGFYVFKLGQKFDFTAKFGIGAFNAYLDQLTIYAEYNSSAPPFDRTFDRKGILKITYALGGHFTYHINNKWGILLAGTFTSSNPEYTLGGVIGGDYRESQNSQKTAFINTNIGLSFSIE